MAKIPTISSPQTAKAMVLALSGGGGVADVTPGGVAPAAGLRTADPGAGRRAPLITPEGDGFVGAAASAGPLLPLTGLLDPVAGALAPVETGLVSGLGGALESGVSPTTVGAADADSVGFTSGALFSELGSLTISLPCALARQHADSQPPQPLMRIRGG